VVVLSAGAGARGDGEELGLGVPLSISRTWSSGLLVDEGSPLGAADGVPSGCAGPVVGAAEGVPDGGDVPAAEGVLGAVADPSGDTVALAVSEGELSGLGEGDGSGCGDGDAAGDGVAADCGGGGVGVGRNAFMRRAYAKFDCARGSSCFR
jgi:hypothetical protein